MIINIQLLKFRRNIKNVKKNIVIVDLDNTIADTWVLRNKGYSEKYIYQNVKLINETISFIRESFSNTKNDVYILTARNYRYYYTTNTWLLSHSIHYPLYMVPNPEHKLKFIGKNTCQKIVWIDDLSYNHENGDVKFYNSVIDQLKYSKNITYLDYNFIQELKNGKKSN